MKRSRETYSCGPSSSTPATNNATPNGRLITLSWPSAPSPNLSARSQIACVQLSTPSFSLKWKEWFCDSTRACSIIDRASACRPDMAQPMWESISTIFSTEDVSRRVDVTRFSTPRRTPWEVAICTNVPLAVRSATILKHGVDCLTPIAVDPSLMASKEYSTWKRRPSGEKVLQHF